MYKVGSLILCYCYDGTIDYGLIFEKRGTSNDIYWGPNFISWYSDAEITKMLSAGQCEIYQ